MSKEKPFDPKAERRIGKMYSDKIEANLKVNISSRFNSHSGELKTVSVHPRYRKKQLAYLAIEGPAYAFVHNFGTNKANKIKKEQVKGFTRLNRKTKKSRFRKGYQTVKPFSRMRKKNIKQSNFINDSITGQIMNGLADDITKLRADEVIAKVFI